MDRRRLLTGLGTLALAGCGSQTSDPRLKSEAPIAVRPAPAPPSPPLPPVRLPADEGPHDALAEWWYYTGHLYPEGDEAEEYGFELVFFRAVRGQRPPGYAAHFGVADLAQGRFRYDQRSDVALNERRAPAGSPPGQAGSGATIPGGADGARPVGTVSLPVPDGGFDLALADWRVRGREGRDSLRAAMPGYRLELSLEAQRPPALHLGDPPVFPGLISLGTAGYSYYYSRTRMAVEGTLEVEGEPRRVSGLAWMDHQWGDFLVLGGGGWDWFAGNLRDGRDLTFSVVRDGAGAVTMVYGTLVGGDGESRHLPPGALAVEATGWWTSPATGIRYPSGWRVRVPDEGLDLLWTPLLADQELDTRPSTGVIYWEGAVRLEDAVSGADAGRGYVELTGYTASG